MSLPARDIVKRIGTAIALDADVLLSGRYAKDIRLLLETTLLGEEAIV